jgi:hypothetical protein
MRDNWLGALSVACVILAVIWFVYVGLRLGQ